VSTANKKDAATSREFNRTIAIDSRRESYGGFFQNDWANGLLDIASSSLLFEPAVDLLRNWSAASRVTECTDPPTRQKSGGLTSTNDGRHSRTPRASHTPSWGAASRTLTETMRASVGFVQSWRATSRQPGFSAYRNGLGLAVYETSHTLCECQNIVPALRNDWGRLSLNNLAPSPSSCLIICKSIRSTQTSIFAFVDLI
jgi:hypothetical protein